MSTRTEIVLVHGLWYGPLAMAVLAGRLRKAGFEVRKFGYPATSFQAMEHARRLLQFVAKGSAGQTHFVGHSLGGLVIAKALELNAGSSAGDLPQLDHCRAVLLGTPLRGSSVVRRALKLPGGQSLFREAAEDLSRGQPQLPANRRIGLIAGSRSWGLGRLLGQPANGSDGTVALSETESPGLADRLVLPVSHTGMLFSAEVARQTVFFLQSGHFPGAGIET